MAHWFDYLKKNTFFENTSYNSSHYKSVDRWVRKIEVRATTLLLFTIAKSMKNNSFDFSVKITEDYNVTEITQCFICE